MLAAISHDLRTPITSCACARSSSRTRRPAREVLATLDEMQRMTEATLAFAREEATREDDAHGRPRGAHRELCEDLADLGREVTCDWRR